MRAPDCARADWDLGHSDDRTSYSGPEHRRCNRLAGATHADDVRYWSRVWYEPVPDDVVVLGG